MYHYVPERKLFLLLFTLALPLLIPAGCSREGESLQRDKEPNALAAAGPNRAAAPGGAVADHRPVIVAFGDSLTAGLGVDAESSYPSVLERELQARGRPYRVVNAGVSGDTTSGGLTRVDTVIAYKPSIVILELGANDGLRGLPVESTRSNLEQLIVALQGAGAKVVLAGMTLPPNYGPEYIQAFERIFVDLAEKYHTARIPFLLENVAGHPDRMQPDGLHPNAAGQKIVAANVWRAIEPLLD
jgi:acyl-CoA thioesterase-1